MDGGKHETYGVLRCECSDVRPSKRHGPLEWILRRFSSFLGEACAAKRGFSVSLECSGGLDT